MSETFEAVRFAAIIGVYLITWSVAVILLVLGFLWLFGAVADVFSARRFDRHCGVLVDQQLMGQDQ